MLVSTTSQANENRPDNIASSDFAIIRPDVVPVGLAAKREGDDSRPVQAISKIHSAEPLLQGLHWQPLVNRELRRVRRDIAISANIALGTAVITVATGLLSPMSSLMFLTGSLCAHLLDYRRVALMPIARCPIQPWESESRID